MIRRFKSMASSLVDYVQSDRLDGTTPIPGSDEELSFPPLQYRRTVGPTDVAAFDNSNGDRIWGDLALGPLAPGEVYRKVFDFGCGCGRNARQLLLQNEPPERYLGVDVHPGMIRWCQKHLKRRGVDIRFDHHDVWSPTYAPDNSRRETLPLRQYGDDFTLVNAHSVFTHLYERQTEFYLDECRALIGDRGVLRTTWFIFNREWFPVLAPNQHSLFVNDSDPSQAVYFDWQYMLDLFRRLDLKIIHVVWTTKPGYQNEIYLAKGAEFEDVIANGLEEPPGRLCGFGDSVPPPYDGPE